MFRYFRSPRSFKKTLRTFIVHYIRALSSSYHFTQILRHISQYYRNEFFALCLVSEIWLFWEILKTKDTGVYWSFRWAFPEFVLICMQFKYKVPSIDLQVSIVKPAWVCGYLAQQKISLNVTTLKFACTGRTCHWHSMPQIHPHIYLYLHVCYFTILHF